MKYKKSMLIFSLIIVTLFCISCVAASDINDTAVSNEDIGNDEIISTPQEEILSESDDGTFTALQSKINAASSGDIITLDRDYTYDEKFAKNGIIIAKDLTINGNGHTLNGLSKSRILFITPGLIENNKITLNNIKFKNGYTDLYGGAILNFANLTLDKCTFTNNFAGTTGGAITSVGNLNYKNCVFNKNSANGSAGAVFSLSTDATTEFLKNHTSEDVGELILKLSSLEVYVKHVKEYVKNCTFTNNVAKANGGAIYAFSHIDISSCTFTSNKATGSGGAVFGCKDLYIKNSKFTNNQASKYGGAVYFKCHELTTAYVNGDWTSKVVYYSNLIQGSTFTKNVAKKGGAIYGFRYSANDKTHCAKAVKCTFTDNKASSSGRDVYGGTTSNCIFNYYKLTLKSVDVKKSAKKLVLTATLKKGSTLQKYKKIIFKFNGKTYTAKTNSKGIAKVTIKSNVLKKLTVGKTVTYQAKYSTITVKKTAKVKK